MKNELWSILNKWEICSSCCWLDILPDNVFKTRLLWLYWNVFVGEILSGFYFIFSQNDPNGTAGHLQVIQTHLEENGPLKPLLWVTFCLLFCKCCYLYTAFAKSVTCWIRAYHKKHFSLDTRLFGIMSDIMSATCQIISENKLTKGLPSKLTTIVLIKMNVINVLYSHWFHEDKKIHKRFFIVEKGSSDSKIL